MPSSLSGLRNLRTAGTSFNRSFKSKNISNPALRSPYFAYEYTGSPNFEVVPINGYAINDPAARSPNPPCWSKTGLNNGAKWLGKFLMLKVLLTLFSFHKRQGLRWKIGDEDWR